jgi:hypothetical protein
VEGKSYHNLLSLSEQLEHERRRLRQVQIKQNCKS